MAHELTDGDILLYTLRYIYQGQQLLNTWHWKVTQFEPALIDYEDACDAILLEVSGLGTTIETLLPGLTPGCVIQNHEVQRVYPQRNRAIRHNINLMGTGGATGSQSNQAAVVTKHGNISARYAIGSWHQGGLPVSAFQADGTVATATRDIIEEALTFLMDMGDIEGFPDTSLTPVLWSPKDPIRVTPVTGLIPQATSRVMRRRTVGLGI